MAYITLRKTRLRQVSQPPEPEPETICGNERGNESIHVRASARARACWTHRGRTDATEHSVSDRLGVPDFPVLRKVTSPSGPAAKGFPDRGPKTLTRTWGGPPGPRAEARGGGRTRGGTHNGSEPSARRDERKERCCGVARVGGCERTTLIEKSGFLHTISVFIVIHSWAAEAPRRRIRRQWPSTSRKRWR
jgi:hypothetical protein